MDGVRPGPGVGGGEPAEGLVGGGQSEEQLAPHGVPAEGEQVRRLHEEGQRDQH